MALELRGPQAYLIALEETEAGGARSGQDTGVRLESPCKAHSRATWLDTWRQRLHLSTLTKSTSLFSSQISNRNTEYSFQNTAHTNHGLHAEASPTLSSNSSALTSNL